MAVSEGGNDAIGAVAGNALGIIALFCTNKIFSSLSLSFVLHVHSSKTIPCYRYVSIQEPSWLDVWYLRLFGRL